LTIAVINGTFNNLLNYYGSLDGAIGLDKAISSIPVFDNYSPTLSPTQAPTNSSNATSEYIVMNQYIDNTCYGDVQLQVGYQTEVCIANGINNSFVLSCSQPYIYNKTYTTSDCTGNSIVTSVTEVDTCLKDNIAFSCRSVESYYDLILMDSGNTSSFSTHRLIIIITIIITIILIIIIIEIYSNLN
jgi:hypothetical protein